METFLIAIVGGSIAVAALAIAFAWVYVVLDGLFGPLKLPKWLIPKPPTSGWGTEDAVPEDITEPVLKLLDLMKTEPGRFCVNVEEGVSTIFWHTYLVIDRSTKATLRVSCRHVRGHGYFPRPRDSDTWLADDEILAVHKQATQIHDSRTQAWEQARNKVQRDRFQQKLDKGSN